MSEPFEPIHTEQVFSRNALGFLWAKRDKLDPGQRSILDALYMGRKKGSVDGSLKVEYRLPRSGVGKLGFGRCYGSKGSLETLEKECRGTMCREFYDDIDIVNCHPVLLCQFAQHYYQIELPEVEKYCDNRDEYLSKIGENKDEAKQAILKIFYNGKNEHSFLAPMATEIKNFIKKQLMVDDKYKVLLEYVRKQESNTYGSFLSHILQTEERKVMLAMRQSFINQGFRVDVLCYDGIMIRKERVPLTNEVINNAQSFIHTTSNYNVKLLNKPFQFFEVTEQQKDETEEIAPKITKQDYLAKKLMFEESHFYYSPTAEIVEVTSNGKLYYRSIDHAIIEYIEYDFSHSNNLLDSTSFIKLWMKDPTRRTIKQIDMKPSDNITHYNPPLAFLYNTFPKANNPKAIELFTNLLKVLCGHSVPIYEYALNWLAHIIQTPYNKTGTCLIFTGAKGCGKDTFGDFIVEWVIGIERAHTYDSTSQFWDKHDISRENRFMIKLEEVNGILNRQHIGEMKQRVTGSSITVNEKQHKPRTTSNYCNFMMTTNEGQPVKVEEGERRFNVIPCSPEWVGNFAKWKEIREVLFNPEGASTIGHFLMEHTIPSTFEIRQLPENDYLDMGIEVEESSESQFIKQWRGEDIKMTDFYNQYVDYCTRERLPFAPNSKSLGIRLLTFIRDKLIKKHRYTSGVVYSNI